MKEQQFFYQGLYRKRNNRDSEIDFFGTPLPVLNNVDKNSCEGALTEYECKQALFDMKNERSPGSDGLTVEFYKTCWDTLRTFFVDSINYSFENGSLSTLQKQGIITLLPKDGKNLEILSNWQPITLLNTDYKIATKAILNRLKKVLPSVINPSQTGIMKNRYIGEEIRIIQESIDYPTDEDKPGLIFFADFEKAFDSVSHDFIY